VKGAPLPHLKGHRSANPRINFTDALPFKIEGHYCKLIPLTKGMYAIVWQEDYARIAKSRWVADWNPHTRSFYARRCAKGIDGKRGHISMSREIMDIQDGDIRKVDHENHDTLDDRRSNLRIASTLQNASNRKKNQNNKSGYKGVHLNKATGRWQAYIRVETKLIHLGIHSTAEEAYAAYCAAALRLHGEFARLA
jgi:hypothetical protein